MADNIGHNIELIDEWISKLQGNTNYYDDLVRNLYSAVDSLVGTDFQGGLSEDFKNNIYNKRKDFTDYSDTFSECIKYMIARRGNIESDEQYLHNQIESGNAF